MELGRSCTNLSIIFIAIYRIIMSWKKYDNVLWSFQIVYVLTQV